MAVHTEQRKRESCESVASSIPTPHTWIHIIVFPGPAETKISKAYLFYIILMPEIYQSIVVVVKCAESSRYHRQIN